MRLMQRKGIFRFLGGGSVIDPTPPIEEFGAGANAPNWPGKTIYPIETFAAPVPNHPSSPNAAGFKGWDFVDPVVTYPVVSTPYGVKPVLQILFRGSSHTIDADEEFTTSWAADSAWAVRVTGTWSGTLQFEVSDDEGETWTPVTLRGTRAAGESNATTGSSTTVNGTWASDHENTASGRLFRVRASVWTSGSATLAIGMQGGGSPARMLAGTWEAGHSKIYFHVPVFICADWSNGGNSGTKFTFFEAVGGNGHYTGVIGGLDDGVNENKTTTFVALQGNSLNRNMPSTSFKPNGQWVSVEFLFEANTPGIGDGIAKGWMDGDLTNDVDDVEYFIESAIAEFVELYMNPTYGGGEAPPPRDVYYQLAGWYRESAP